MKGRGIEGPEKNPLVGCSVLRKALAVTPHIDSSPTRNSRQLICGASDSGKMAESGSQRLATQTHGDGGAAWGAKWNLPLKSNPTCKWDAAWGGTRSGV